MAAGAPPPQKKRLDGYRPINLVSIDKELFWRNLALPPLIIHIVYFGWWHFIQIEEKKNFWINNKIQQQQKKGKVKYICWIFKETNLWCTNYITQLYTHHSELNAWDFGFAWWNSTTTEWSSAANNYEMLSWHAVIFVFSTGDMCYPKQANLLSFTRGYSDRHGYTVIRKIQQHRLHI